MPCWFKFFVFHNQIWFWAPIRAAFLGFKFAHFFFEVRLDTFLVNLDANDTLMTYLITIATWVTPNQAIFTEEIVRKVCFHEVIKSALNR